MDELRQQEERNKFQEEAVALSKQHKHLLIEAATGTGKGLAVMKSIAASPSTKKWLIVVPEILQMENYKQDLIKHGYEWMFALKIEEIICYASLSKYRGRDLNLGLNECHRLSDARLDTGFTIKFDQIISDSATVPIEVKQRLWELCPYHVLSLPIDEAIERGILPPPSIHLVPVILDDVIKRHKTKMGKVNYLLTDKKMAANYDRQIKYWTERHDKTVKDNIAETGDDSDIPWIKRRIITIGGARKKFLASCKTSSAKKLINSLGKRRMIVFCGSVEQSEELGDVLSLNSSRGTKHNKETLEKFNNLLINQLYVNKMGREGLNLNKIEIVILVQLDSGNDEGTSFIQKIGRGMRADVPEVYILYCKDTHDDVFLKRALNNIDKKYIQ